MGRFSPKALLKCCLLLVVGALTGLWVGNAVSSAHNLERLCRQKRGLLPYRPLAVHTSGEVNSSTGIGSSQEDTNKSRVYNSTELNSVERFGEHINASASGYESLRAEEHGGMKLERRGTLFVGVSTIEHRLRTQATAIEKTWGKHRVQNVSFFIQGTEVPKDSTDLQTVTSTVVSLASKADPSNHFALAGRTIQYMYDKHIDEYDWFMWTKDTVYVHGANMLSFLSAEFDTTDKGCVCLGASKDLVMNDRVGFHCDEKAGVVFSRSLLLKVGPTLESCLQNSTALGEEDEHCLYQLAGVQCAEMPTFPLKAAQENAPPKKKKTASLLQARPYHDTIATALTVYDIPDPLAMYSLHLAFLEREAERSLNRTSEIFHEMLQLQHKLRNT